MSPANMDQPATPAGYIAPAEMLDWLRLPTFDDGKKRRVLAKLLNASAWVKTIVIGRVTYARIEDFRSLRKMLHNLSDCVDDWESAVPRYVAKAERWTLPGDARQSISFSEGETP